MKKLFFLGTSFLIVIIGLVAQQYYIFYHHQDYKNTAHSLQQTHQVIGKLKAVWKLGDIKKSWASKKLVCNKTLGNPQLVGPHYLRCNPDYIDCLIKNNQLLGDKKYKQFSFEILGPKDYSHYKIIKSHQLSNSDIKTPINYLFILRHKNRFTPILLEDSCNEVFLPTRKYGAVNDNVSKKRFSFTWNNFNTSIFIDKYLVTNLAIKRWLNFTQNNNQKVNIQGAPFAIADNLNPQQMQQYCQYAGKQLLKSHIYDAATFHPINYKNNRPHNIYRYPYLDGKRSKMYSLLLENEGAEQDENKRLSFCKKIYTQECLKQKPFFHFSNVYPAWSGIFQIAGGPLEYTPNVLRPNHDINATSYYFPLKSSFQSLGVRLKLKGSRFLRSNLIGLRQVEMAKMEDSINVGFRCMRYVYAP